MLRRASALLVALALACSPALQAHQAAASGAAASSAPAITDEYRDVAARLLGAALTDEEGWQKLVHITTRIGPRLSGSAQLDAAVRWAAQVMREEGLENVQLQPVKVPHWVRGNESLELLAPAAKPLAMLGLGNSVGTPPEGITAPVVVVRNFDELAQLGEAGVRGKIVLYAVEWQGYGRTVQYRSTGPSRAARLGAVAVLVRSATGRSLYTPHTGGLNYAADVPQIPAAAITPEDAAWLARLADAGVDIRVRLKMDAKFLPDADSANVIAEITGREKPEEIVVLGGHMDSWDVGHGAHDDAVGVIATWQAVTLMKRLGLRPRRTIRVVAWTNEENGLRGGNAYRQWVGDKVGHHVAAIEMDGGAERPVGFGFGPGANSPQWTPAHDTALRKLQEIGTLLEAIDAGTVTRGGGGADIGPLTRDGVPGLGLRTVGEHYFDWHHTHADTLDKVDKDDFRRCIALLAVFTYIIADLPDRLVSP